MARLVPTKITIESDDPDLVGWFTNKNPGSEVPLGGRCFMLAGYVISIRAGNPQVKAELQELLPASWAAA